jgi:hypothetical protein
MTQHPDVADGPDGVTGFDDAGTPAEADSPYSSAMNGALDPRPADADESAEPAPDVAEEYAESIPIDPTPDQVEHYLELVGDADDSAATEASDDAASA